MSEDEIKQKLLDNGLDKYIAVFDENHLFDESVLSSLTDEDYISIGITILGDRKKLQILFGKNDQSLKDDTVTEYDAAEIKEEFINVLQDGKEFCYLSTAPDKMLCKNCHKPVSVDSTLCPNCNNNLVVQNQASNSYESLIGKPLDENINHSEDTPKKSKSGKIITSIVAGIFLVIIIFTCSSGSKNKKIISITPSSGYSSPSYSKNESYKSRSRDLSDVSVSFSSVQLMLVTPETLHNVKLRLNGDYIYKISILEPGSYTVGLGAFSDSKGNRFNPFAQKVLRISIFCDEGSTYLTPVND